MVSKKGSRDVECLDIIDVEDEGFFEGDINLGNTVAAFSFNMAADSEVREALKNQQSSIEKNTIETSMTENNISFVQKGMTPPIDGEYFTIKRGYQLRPSTIRKLNDLRSRHPDLNVYLNTILDAAIIHFYDYIVKEGGHF